MYQPAKWRVARYRLDEHLGVAFIEGEDDRRCLAGRFIPHEQLVVTDGKPMLLDAYRAYERTQGVRYVFVTDCDYDVHAGELKAQPALIVTRNPSLETDLVDIGLLAQIVEEFIPRGKWHKGSTVATVRYVTEQSVALTEGLGRLRCVAREEKLRLRVSTLRERLRKYRRDGQADIDKMVEVLGQQTRSGSPSALQIKDAAEQLDGGLGVCDGHDLLTAVGVILHDDFGVETKATAGIPSVLRTAVDKQAFEKTEVGRRLRKWQRLTGLQVLRA